jgi:hypothetical protein
MRDRAKRKATIAKYWASDKGKANRAKMNRKRVAENNAVLLPAKNVPCMDCGGVYPTCVMDFDHVRGVKLFNIAKVASRAGAADLLAEIAKCDVVCSNCHRIRTQKRLHNR